MAKRVKELLWHRKQGRIISPRALKKQHAKLPDDQIPGDRLSGQEDEFRRFSMRFDRSIKEALSRKRKK